MAKSGRIENYHVIGILSAMGRTCDVLYVSLCSVDPDKDKSVLTDKISPYLCRKVL